MTVASGRGCRQCERGAPTTRIESPAGVVVLCLECTLRWFPGRNGSWFEEQLSLFRDHFRDRAKRAAKRELVSQLLVSQLRCLLATPGVQ